MVSPQGHGVLICQAWSGSGQRSVGSFKAPYGPWAPPVLMILMSFGS